MSFKIQGTVDGMQEAINSLNGVAEKLQKKLAKKAVGEANKHLLRRAKQLVPRDTGLLKKSLGRKVKVERNSGVVVGVVGPRAGFGRQVTRVAGRKNPKTEYADPLKYAHRVELGTRRAGAKPFLRPALDGQQQVIREAVADVIRRGLEEGK